jgi:hypothetical protein
VNLITEEKVWGLYSGRKFQIESRKRQNNFAKKIQRLGKQYFVQTPFKYSPIESHPWLPLIVLFPRWLLVPTLSCTNLFWANQTSPDWHLLNKKDMRILFDNADIIEEKTFKLTKSIMAIRVETKS